jgi:hypothetical protein
MVQAMPRDRGKGARYQQLQQTSDRSHQDNTLMYLIMAVWDAPVDSFQYKRALRNLLEYVQAMLKPLQESSDERNPWRYAKQEADVGFNRPVDYEPLVYLSQNINDFIPTGKTIKSSLIGWLRLRAINRSIDNYRQQQRRDLKPYSLNAPATFTSQISGSQETIERDVADRSPTGLDLILSQLNQQFRDSFTEYVKTDPYGKLKECAMQSPHDRCNCFTLVELLYFHEPPLSKKAAAIELGIDNYSALLNHWRDRCLPLLTQIAQEIAQNTGWEID